MIARQLLHDLFAVILKHDEVADQVQQAVLVEHTFEQRFQLQRTRRHKLLARDGAPRHEPLPIRRDRAEPRFVAVGNHQQRVGVEQRRDLRLVSLELVERLADGGLFIRNVFEFQHRQRDAVDEHHHVRRGG